MRAPRPDMPLWFLILLLLMADVVGGAVGAGLAYVTMSRERAPTMDTIQQSLDRPYLGPWGGAADTAAKYPCHAGHTVVRDGYGHAECGIATSKGLSDGN